MHSKIKNIQIHINPDSLRILILFANSISEDEFVDDSGYTVSSHKTLERSISSADIELANKINILKESGLI